MALNLSPKLCTLFRKHISLSSLTRGLFIIKEKNLHGALFDAGHVSYIYIILFWFGESAY